MVKALNDKLNNVFLATTKPIITFFLTPVFYNGNKYYVVYMHFNYRFAFLIYINTNSNFAVGSSRYALKTTIQIYQW